MTSKVIAFANGLRKKTILAGRRWVAWPGGAEALATVIARIDEIQQPLHGPVADPARAEAGMADLRAILEWTTYQSASVATARAILVARRTRTFAERFRLLDDPVSVLAELAAAELSLIENVRTKNGYMQKIAERHPHLALPAPFVDIAIESAKHR